MDKLNFNAGNTINKQTAKESIYKKLDEYRKLIEESTNDNDIEYADKKISELIKQQKEINDSRYVPSPYDSSIKEKTKVEQFGKTKVKFTNNTVSSPFIQCNPVSIYSILKTGRKINVLGRNKQDKLSVGEGGLIKLYMYIASIVKKDSNFIRLDKDKVMQYTGIGTNGYAEYLRILNRLNVLVEIKNMRSCYVINHNVIYNGYKADLCEWLNSNKQNKVEMKKDENKNYTYIEIDEANKAKLNNTFRNITFEPFEENE